ncbi:hypothetical protein, partial [Hallella multisaccharivorax]|uniref:hypothetical protein n=1 Tax=Hallella multisaccharivorax TaxID=310514 RepID=UPI001CC68C27
LADFLGSLITGAIGFHRRGIHTIKFGSKSGFAWTSHHLHSSTGTSVAPRPCHCSVSTSPVRQVTEY